MQLPENHQAIIPYLILRQVEDFIRFTEKAFGGTLKFKKMRDGQDVIQHAEILISGSTIMVAEATGQWKPATANIFLYAENADDTYTKALAAGATSVMAPVTQEYGRTCGINDPFGNVWWITTI